MQYSEGQLGRIFVMRIDHGEDLLESLPHFLQEKDVRAGILLFLGALAEGAMVTGPEQLVIPPVPHFEEIAGGWEIFGIATIYTGESEPEIHLHASAGRGDRSLTGCLRERAKVYLVVEAVLLEFRNLYARRVQSTALGISVPALKKDLNPP